MPTWIPILRPPGPIISSNKTQNNETGEVYWADLVPRSGSEQQGRRPVVVISHDAFNQTQGWRSIIVVPFSTSAAQAGRGPSAVLLPQGAAGLGKDSVALCHQVTTLGQHPSRDLFWRVWGREGHTRSRAKRKVPGAIQKATGNEQCMAFGASPPSRSPSPRWRLAGWSPNTDARPPGGKYK
ncbi:MAG: type II toxin-antitoxin system PemK/MazF family toxin [Acidobacteriota bacterium]|nr:type II toxin-antitoxin system PemK/MazF family toxin [Acidobacteriota bacterium]